jgi:hypothetical protein
MITAVSRIFGDRLRRKPPLCRVPNDQFGSELRNPARYELVNRLPNQKPSVNGDLRSFALLRRSSATHAGIASRSAPASRHNCATHRARGSPSFSGIAGPSPKSYIYSVGITQTPLPGPDAAAIGMAAFLAVYMKGIWALVKALSRDGS